MYCTNSAVDFIAIVYPFNHVRFPSIHFLLAFGGMETTLVLSVPRFKRNCYGMDTSHTSL
jgi:hypothetical protein